MIEISIGAIQKQEGARDFNLNTHAIADFYTRILNVEKLPYEKIAIRLFNFPPKRFSFNSDGVLVADVHAEILPYFALGERERKFWILHQLQSAIRELTKSEAISLEPFEKAYHECLLRGLVNEFPHSETIYFNDYLTGFVFCRHESDGFRFCLKVLDKEGMELCEEHLYKVEPYYLEYYKYLGNVAYSNKKSILHLFDIYGKVFCEVPLTSIMKSNL
jgi:hypothetical protein